MSASPALRRTGQPRRHTCRTSPGRLETLEVLRPVAQQEGGACARARRAVARVVELALGKRQAAAADAAVEPLAGPLQHVDARLQRAANAPADRLPILVVRRAPLRQGRELGLDLGQ